MLLTDLLYLVVVLSFLMFIAAALCQTEISRQRLNIVIFLLV